MQTYHTAGLAGIGLIQAGYTVLAPCIQSGALVEVLSHPCSEPLPTSFVVTRRRNLSPRVWVSMAWIEGLLEPYLD